MAHYGIFQHLIFRCMPRPTKPYWTSTWNLTRVPGNISIIKMQWNPFWKYFVIHAFIFQGPSSLHLDRWYWRGSEVQDQDSWGVSQLSCWPANLELWWVILLPGLISHEFFVIASTIISQAEGSNSDTYLHPVKFYPDPFRLVLILKS